MPYQWDQFGGTNLPDKFSGRSLPLARAIPERLAEIPEPKTGFLFTDPNANGTGEVSEEARINGWTVQRPRARQYLPVAIVHCVACWAAMDPNDEDRHQCSVMTAAASGSDG